MNCAVCLGEHTPEVGCTGTLVRTHASAPLPLHVIAKDPDDALIGSSVGSFRIVRKLGRGGMGTVFLAEHSVIGSRVAVKILHPHLASNASLVSRFYAEARAVNLIGHENIVNIFDMSVIPSASGDGPGRYYLIMEYLEGKALTSLTKGPLDAKVALPILIQVCDALQAAHSNGVVHRDLKPENIFLVKRGRHENVVKLLDFGIAKLFGNHAPGQTTDVGVIVGTPEYMAPEQTTGENVDGRVDLYALGIISYLLATGRLPFTTGGITGILLAHRDTVPPAPHEVNDQVPLPWSNAIMKALAKNPVDRHRDAAELREELEKALTELVFGTPTPPAGAAQPLVSPPTPQLMSTPQPVDSRHIAAFQARVDIAGQQPSTHACMDLSRGGLFLCEQGAIPPLFARLTVTLLLEETPLTLTAEVVRHVTADQAKAWGMAPGFAVQFVDLPAAAKEDLARLVAGLPLARPVMVPVSANDDPSAEPVLLHYRKRIAGDHYVVLALAGDTETSDIRHRAREAKKQLEALRQKNLSASQRAQLETALARVNEAFEVLGMPLTRVDYDAQRGNFRGVARSISAGLSVTDLEAVRQRFLLAHPSNESRAVVHFTSGNAFENHGQTPAALAEYEKALALDPLNLRYQQRYWGLKKKSSS